MRSFLIVAVLAITSVAHAEIKEGWSVGSGGKVYGGAREACQGFLKETESGGVKYVIDRMEQTHAGDMTCWHKNQKDDGPAVSQTLVYRVRRQTYEGIPIFRGTTEAKRREPKQLEHDLGPGFYFYKEQWVARAYAQAAFLEAYTDRGTTSVDKVPDGIVWDHDFKAPDDVFDFTAGPLLHEFEAVACTELGTDAAENMFDGEVNPVRYYKAFSAFVAKHFKGAKKLSDLPIVIGPDYRHSIAGGDQRDPKTDCDAYIKKAKNAADPAAKPERRQAQIRISDKAIVDKLQKTAMRSLETRFPSKEDVAASLVGHVTSAPFKACAPTASSKCALWPHQAGQLIFLRRGWQAVLYYGESADKKLPGNHWHLRIGDVLIDGTFMQFDLSVKDQEGLGLLFVGSREELIQRIDNFSKPAGGESGKRIVQIYYDTQPKVVGGKQPRLVYRSGPPAFAGEAVWDPKL